MTPASYSPPEKAEDIRPLLIGAKVPDITLTTVEGQPFDLTAAIAQAPTIILFYRGGW